MSRSGSGRLARVLVAGGLGGVLVAGSELLFLTLCRGLGDARGLVLPLAHRLALLGLAIAVLWGIGSEVGAALRRRGLGIVAWAPLAALAATSAWLVLTGRVSSESARTVSLFFLLAGILGPLLVLAAAARRWRRAPRWPVALLGLAAAAGLAFVDPRRLRGTYAPFDLMLLGLALAGAGLFLSLVVTRPRARLLGAAALVVLLAAGMATESLREPLDAVTLRSPRLRLLERTVFQRLFGGGAAGPEVQAVDEAELFAPPEPAEATRAAWRARRGDDRPRSVLWVTVDALRTDATGAGGGDCTPRLDALAAEGVAFRNAFAQAPGTFGSVGSMFRSRYPGSRYAAPEDGSREADLPPLAQILREGGFHTRLLSGIPQATFRSRMFAELPVGFDQVIPAAGETDAMVCARQFEELLDDPDVGRFFCWVHLFDPHDPYVPREGVPPGAPPKEAWRGEVRYADRALGRMLDALAAAGRDRDTVVVVHADHAEAFGEHGRYFHSTSYFDVQIHVPLVFRAPGIARGVSAAPAENVDIVPTLLDLLELPTPGWMQGGSLLPALLDPGIDWPRAAFAESLDIGASGHWAMDRVRMATDGRWKLLRYLDDDLVLLFDREDDPGETRNLARSEPGHTGRLLGYLDALDRHLGRAPGRPSGGAAGDGEDPLVERLRSEDQGERLEAAAEILARKPHGRVGALERALPDLPPGAAHQVLLLLDTVLIDLDGAPPREVPLPAEPGPVRFRLLERYARSSRYRACDLPDVPGPRSRHEELALAEARAARGSRADLDALRRIEPASRALWSHVAPALAMGSDADGAALLAGSLRGDYPGPKTILLALRSLAAARADAFADAVCARWPSAQAQLPERTYASLVGLATSVERRAWLPALLALFAGAAPADKARVLEAAVRLDPRLSAARIEALARAWTEGRYRSLRGGGGALLQEALSALPEGVTVPLLESEAARARSGALRTVTGGDLALEVARVPEGPEGRAPGPPRVTLAAAGDPVALGPGGVDAVVLEWSGPRRVPAARLSLPRRLLEAGRPLTLVAPLDYPRAPGTWRLEGVVEERHERPGVAPRRIRIERVLGTTTHRVAERLRFDAEAVARLCRPQLPQLPLRLLPGAAGLEQLDGLSNALHLPELALPAGTVRVRVRFTAWFQGGDELPLTLDVLGRAPVALGATRSGETATLEGTLDLPAAARHALSLTWVPRSALVEIERIEVLP